MHSRTGLILALVVVSAQRPHVHDPDRIEDQGWAGPHPSKLVSYHVEVKTGKNSAWGRLPRFSPRFRKAAWSLLG